MARVRTALITLALALTAPVLTALPSSAAPASEAGPATVLNDWVYVGQHAQPSLAIRSSPGTQGGAPGTIVGSVMPGGPLWANCWREGATITQWNRSSNRWVYVEYNGVWRWAWAGGLFMPNYIPHC
ncbi:hypothetical protein [Kribbella sp. NPDC023855]|uniref:hypothetical protein n=1 Tax=Kribbella sp. NPDC023855 TaxID=3154698 RepID=UPI0034090359